MAAQTSQLTISLGQSKTFVFLSLFAAVVTLVGFALTFPPVKRAVLGRDVSLQWTVVSELPVYDIRRPLPELSVTYQGQDLVKENQTIVISTIRLSNDGNEPVGPNILTELDPLGFDVSGGSLIRVLATDSSSAHLRGHLYSFQRDNSVLIRRGVIFDPGDFVTFSLLIRKQPNSRLTFNALGKVGGQDDLRFVDKQEVEQDAFLWTAFKGNPLIQITRLLSYFLLGLSLIIAAAFIGDKLADWSRIRKTRSRQQVADHHISSINTETPAAVLLIGRLYVNVGLRGLLKLRSILSRPGEFDNKYKRINQIREHSRFKKRSKESDISYIDRVSKMARSLDVFIVMGEELDLFDVSHGSQLVDFDDALDKAIDALTMGPDSKIVQKNEPKGDPHSIVFSGPFDYVEWQESRGLITERFIIDDSDSVSRVDEEHALPQRT